MGKQITNRETHVESGTNQKEARRKNKAGYTATKVACGWADHLGRSSEVKEIES